MRTILRKMSGLLLVACLLAPGAQAQSGPMDKLSLEALTAPSAGGSGGGYAPSRHRAARAYRYRAYRPRAYRHYAYRHRALRGYGRYAQPRHGTYSTHPYRHRALRSYGHYTPPRHGAYRAYAYPHRVLPGYGRYVQPRHGYAVRGRHSVSLRHHDYYRPRFQHPRFTQMHAFHAVRGAPAFVQYDQSWRHGN